MSKLYCHNVIKIKSSLIKNHFSKYENYIYPIYKSKLIKYLIIIFLSISMNSCKIINYIISEKYIENFNKRTIESLEIINKKITNIDNIIKNNKDDIEKLKYDLIILEDKNEKK